MKIYKINYKRIKNNWKIEKLANKFIINLLI